MVIELTTVIVGIIFIIQVQDITDDDTFITDKCSQHIDIDPTLVPGINKIYSLTKKPTTGELNFNFIISALIVLSTIISIFML